MAITDLLKKGESLFSTTLVSGISTGTGETITLDSVTGLPTDTEITLTFDRVDADDAETPAKTERITGTISGSTLTSYTRGTDGSTEQAHSAEAVVEYIFNSQDWNDLIDALLVEHSQAGAHTTDTISEKTATAGVTIDGVKLKDSEPYCDIINEKTSDAGVTIDGVKLKDNDATLDEISAKTASTPVKFNDAHYVPETTYTPSAAATATLDVSQASIHKITMPAGNITIAISNETNGQCFLVEITQDGVGSRTVTWFSTIKWAGGSAPTLTTTASKRDTFGFRVTGTDTYDGFVVGANI